MPDASLRSKSHRNRDRPSQSALMAVTSVVASGDPAELDALRSLPVRVFPKKVRPRYSRGWVRSIRSRNGDLHEVLQSQGVLPRQHVTFLSDGGDTVRELPAYLHPHSEHILDWFHIGMRVEQFSQTARGFRGTYDCLITKEKILKGLERVKWFLWHGNVFRAMRH